MGGRLAIPDPHPERVPVTEPALIRPQRPSPVIMLASRSLAVGRTRGGLTSKAVQAPDAALVYQRTQPNRICKSRQT